MKTTKDLKDSAIHPDKDSETKFEPLVLLKDSLSVITELQQKVVENLVCKCGEQLTKVNNYNKVVGYVYCKNCERQLAEKDKMLDAADRSVESWAKDYLTQQKQIKAKDKRIAELEEKQISDDFISLEKERFEWSKKTFPAMEVLGGTKHARLEIDEIEDSIKNGSPDPVEYADAIMCLLDSAARCGLSVEEIIKAFRKKHEINKARKWELHEDGYYFHLKPQTNE